MKLIAHCGALVALLATIQCGSSSSPVSPDLTLTVALNGTSAAPGTTLQGSVSISPAQTTTATITMSTSDASVATVPATITIPIASLSATFAVTAVGPGTATVIATMNGTSGRSSVLTVTGRTALAGIALSAPTVVEGSSVTGTVTLTAAAPIGGAMVSLSGTDPIIVPPSVTVSAGATSATFPVTARAGVGATPATVTASYAGMSASADLSITKPAVATASFGVTGPSETETCEMSNGGRTLSCTFDAHTSAAPGNIVAYDWSYAVNGTFSQTTTGAVLINPTVDCSLMPSPPMPPGNPWFTMTVTLKIHDERGNVAQATNGGVRLLPRGTCGF